MKLNDLVGDFGIYTNAEEQTLLDDISAPVLLSQFDQRQSFILEGLVKKSLVSKVTINGQVYLVKNEI